MLTNSVNPVLKIDVMDVAPRITDTDIAHHPDGSHTVEHTMSDGTKHEGSGAVADMDGLHDKLHDNLFESPQR